VLVLVLLYDVYYKPKTSKTTVSTTKKRFCFCFGRCVCVVDGFHVHFHRLEFGLVFVTMQDVLEDFQTGQRRRRVKVKGVLLLFRNVDRAGRMVPHLVVMDCHLGRRYGLHRRRRRCRCDIGVLLFLFRSNNFHRRSGFGVFFVGDCCFCYSFPYLPHIDEEHRTPKYHEKHQKGNVEKTRRHLRLGSRRNTARKKSTHGDVM